jgi:hypothetical protein
MINNPGSCPKSLTQLTWANAVTGRVQCLGMMQFVSLTPGSGRAAWCVKTAPRDSHLGLEAAMAVRVTSSAALVVVAARSGATEGDVV